MLVTATCGAAGIAVLLMTAGCSAASTDGGDGSAGGDASAAAPSATAPSATASSPAAGSPPAGPSPSTTSPPEGTDVPRCQTPDLAGSLAVVEGGASTGHYEVAVVLENQGADPCVLQGWPGVSFVGDGDGEQLGAAGTLDRLSPNDPVTLDPGSAAQAVVQVANAEDYGEECGQTEAGGFRVYPPGEKRSLFVQSDDMTLTACTNAEDELLDVQAFQPMG
jgi:hypothetical protein